MALQLADPTLLETRAFIGGHWTTSGDRFPVTNPATGEIIAAVADMDVGDPPDPEMSGH
jgi:succinate-semialdehyde dehydrogenase/glutarate-semialdehyde dehydrogenase